MSDLTAMEERLVPSPEVRADTIFERLAAAGLIPQVTDYSDHTHIEAEVPESLSAESWREVLALLATADWSGQVDSSASGLSVWAAVRKDTTATVGIFRGRSHQP
ncbi:hypothetical protein [Streptomyces sp. H27-C3]|uniref:hypothetical protein n=1 Tax=Streptomyces sp. H27-C3 TaxID=3046305 RepID=UPI0024BB569B|nr:hypothetical protein [Streptomyces sp. H27-C3]MDJ0461495.1 hypothetical protein [Streptomyces sp. H27-C3]